MPKTKVKPIAPSPSDLEHKLAETEALFMSIGEGAIVTDSEGNVARVNGTALKILGYKAEELLGMWYPDMVKAEDEDGNELPNLERPITEVFLTGKPVFRKTYFRRKDGSRVGVAVTVSPILLDSKPIGAIEVFRDISDEMRLEKAKDEFIALASHQLRTPATGVKQYAGMLLDEYAGKLSQDQFSMVKKIYESNERQINIINDILLVAQVDAGQVNLTKQKTNLTRLLSDIVSEQAHKFKTRSQKVTFSTPHEEVTVLADTARMRMALENIIDNASKYTPEGKNITVSLQNNDDCAEIKVIDEGVGIPQKDQNQIFEKFVRLDNPLSLIVGGTGLGLYWVKKIIDLHGANLSVTSKPKKGSTFTICIPNLH
jgi:PAS domain S-box-containing protein